MPNQVTTEFKYRDTDGPKLDVRIGKLKEAISLENQLGRGQNPTFGTSKLTSSINKEIQLEKQKSREVATIEAQTLKNKQQNAKFLESISKRRIDSEIADEKRLDRERKKVANDFSNSLNKKTSGIQNPGQAVSGGTGIPIGAAAGVLVGSAIAIEIGRESILASRDAASANRVLSASAKETSLSYQLLNKEVDTFARLTLQSDTNAKKTVASIADFAKGAGRLDKLKEFNTSLADLASAKGIKSEELPALLSQLKTGQDEVFDRLKGQNPSFFYEKYAKSIGKTAATLSDLEKAQVRFDVILQSGKLFTGEAEKRFNDAASSVDKISVAYENAKVSIGNVLVPLTEFVTVAGKLASTPSENSLVKSFNEFYNPSKAASIVTLPIKFALNVADKTTKVVADLLFGNDLATQERLSKEYAASILRVNTQVASLRASDTEINSAKLNPFGNIRNFALSNVNLSTGFNDEKVRNEAIQKEVDGANTFVAALKTRIQNALSSGNSGLVQFAKQEFRQFGNLFDLDTREKFSAGFSQAISQGFQKATTQAKDDIPKLRKILSEVFASNDLNSGAKSDLSSQIQQQINASIDAGKEKVRELSKTYNSVFSDLFSKKGANNPIFTAINEGNKAVDLLKENLKGLPAELQNVALSMQSKLNAENLFGARLDNRLDVFGLRESAAGFRNPINPFDPEAEKKRREEIIKRNAPNADFDKLSDTQKRDIYENVLLQDFKGGDKPIDAVNDKSLISMLARERSASKNSENLSLQERLDRQFKVIDSVNPRSEAERAIAERKLIAITEGLNPNELTSSQRERAASARENEADRKARFEQDDRRERAENLAVQKQIADNGKRLLDLVEKGGLRDLNITLKSDGSIDATLGSSATNSDTQNQYQ